MIGKKDDISGTSTPINNPPIIEFYVGVT